MSDAQRHSPWRDDGVTMACAACGTSFEGRGRGRFCSPACRQRAYRLRHQSSAPPVTTPPSPQPVRALTVYECGDCGTFQLGDQRCGECGLFGRSRGVGGHCPHCDEVVVIGDLLE